jgi:hypothetical protein
MAYTLTRWPESRILVIRGSGSGSLEESAVILEALAAQTLVADPTGVLFDVRLLEYVPTAEEARQIATAYGAFGILHRLRMAYVASAGAQYGVARMVQSLSENHGVAASVFTTPEAAISWLASDISAMGA